MTQRAIDVCETSSFVGPTSGVDDAPGIPGIITGQIRKIACPWRARYWLLAAHITRVTQKTKGARATRKVEYTLMAPADHSQDLPPWWDRVTSQMHFAPFLYYHHVWPLEKADGKTPPFLFRRKESLNAGAATSTTVTISTGQILPVRRLVGRS